MDNMKDSTKTSKKHSSCTEAQNSLKQEVCTEQYLRYVKFLKRLQKLIIHGIFHLSNQILQLEKRLQGQFQVRHALEKALGYRNSSQGGAVGNPMPKVDITFAVN